MIYSILKKKKKEFVISEYDKDYHRTISSSVFRRLQDKTQVFPLDKSDYVRTRLTHSIEVATIARQMGMLLKTKKDYLPEYLREEDARLDDVASILSCAGLLHDVGNPPFGHFGEKVIGEWFKDKFESDNFTYEGRK